MILAFANNDANAALGPLLTAVSRAVDTATFYAVTTGTGETVQHEGAAPPPGTLMYVSDTTAGLAKAAAPPAGQKRVIGFTFPAAAGGLVRISGPCEQRPF